MPKRIVAIGALVFGGLAASPLVAQEADLAAQGEKVFRRCAACHQVGDGAKNTVGPLLTGVVGRPAGSVEGYNYSEAMQQAGADGLVWDEEQLSSFLENPRAKVEGTKMAFPGLRKEEERQAVIAYLKTFGEGS